MRGLFAWRQPACAQAGDGAACGLGCGHRLCIRARHRCGTCAWLVLPLHSAAWPSCHRDACVPAADAGAAPKLGHAPCEAWRCCAASKPPRRSPVAQPGEEGGVVVEKEEPVAVAGGVLTPPFRARACVCARVRVCWPPAVPLCRCAAVPLCRTDQRAVPGQSGRHRRSVLCLPRGGNTRHAPGGAARLRQKSGAAHAGALLSRVRLSATAPLRLVTRPPPAPPRRHSCARRPVTTGRHARDCTRAGAGRHRRVPDLRGASCPRRRCRLCCPASGSDRPRRVPPARVRTRACAARTDPPTAWIPRSPAGGCLGGLPQQHSSTCLVAGGVVWLRSGAAPARVAGRATFGVSLKCPARGIPTPRQLHTRHGRGGRGDAEGRVCSAQELRGNLWGKAGRS